MEKKKCTVYIDEAGDLGIGRGTQWFVITAVIVPKESEKEIRAILTRIKSKFNLKEIHLRKGIDFNKTSYIVAQLRNSDFVTVNVLADTNMLSLKDSMMTSKFIQQVTLENIILTTFILIIVNLQKSLQMNLKWDYMN